MSSRPGRTRRARASNRTRRGAGKPGFRLVRPSRGDAAENSVAFPVAAARHVVSRLESRRIGAEQCVDLRFGPDVELPFLAFAVRVFGRSEGGMSGRRARRRHVAHHPVHRLRRALSVEQVRRCGVGERQQFEDLRVVVQHLLEMRHEPHARRSNSARSRRRDGHRYRPATSGAASGAAPLALPGARCGTVLPQETKDRRVGKFRRAAKPPCSGSVRRSSAAPQPDRACAGVSIVAQLAAPITRQVTGEAQRYYSHNFVAAAIRLGNRLQDLAERRSSPTGFGRK